MTDDNGTSTKSGSYERINYGLRPAKAIERKMLCETFRRLSPFGTVESYRYIGFGSTYFSDFILLHRSLGITNMVSIEGDVSNQERFIFNRPFSCVSIEFGDSSEVLAELDWNVRTIIWLDYDTPLDGKILADVRSATGNLIPGSLLIVSVNAHPIKIETERTERIHEQRLQRFRDRVGETKVPKDIDGKDLREWGMASVSRRIISNEIHQTLNERNGGRHTDSRIKYKQLFNFHYADGAKMLTIGGILYDHGQEHLVDHCAFQHLSFVRSDLDPYLIEVPNLTYREIRHLEAQLPAEDFVGLDAPAVPKSDVERFARLYRYFPTFAETEL